MSTTRPPQLIHQRVMVGRHAVGYGVCGDGPPVVLIHGLAGSTRWWRRNVPALAAHLRVYVVDLVGFGSSRGGRFALSEASAVLAGWMDGVGLGQASLVGHSMGGYVAAELAAAEPGRAARLILVDAAVLPFGRTFAQHGFGLVREMLQLSPAFLPLLVADVLRAGPLTMWAAAQAVMRLDLRARLAQIQAPTLLIWGARDQLIPLTVAHALTDALPQSALAVIAGAGHNPMWDRPAAFNRLALEFLASDAPRPVREAWPTGCASVSAAEPAQSGPLVLTGGDHLAHDAQGRQPAGAAGSPDQQPGSGPAPLR